MKRILQIVVMLVLGATFAPAQSKITVTGNAWSLSGYSGSDLKVRGELKNCGINTPVVTGDSQDKVIEVKPDSAGNFTVELWGNDLIDCGGVTGNSRWEFRYMRSGNVIAAARYNITGSGTVDLANLQVEGSLPANAPATAYVQVYDNGAARTKRQALNLIGSSVSCADNSDSARTDCSVKPKFSFSFALPSPAAADSGVYQHRLNFDGTITEVDCSTDMGTVDVNLEVRTDATPNAAGTAVMGVPLSCGASATAHSGALGVAVARDAPVTLMVANPAGTPGVVRVHVFGDEQ